MKRVFGRLIALPIRMLAGVAGQLAFIDTTMLWSVAWKLGRDPQDANELLSRNCRKYGVVSVRQQAEDMLIETKDSTIAARMGFYEFFFKENIEFANRWVRLAEENNCENQELLLRLKLVLADFSNECNSEAIEEQILSRNDLPAQTTLTALLEKGNRFLESSQWDEAEAIANRILDIEEQSDARIIKWVVHMAKDNQELASKQLARARGNIPDSIFNIFVGQGWLFLGQKEKAMELLCKADLGLHRLRERKSLLGQFVCSEEFQKYCEEKQ